MIVRRSPCSTSAISRSDCVSAAKRTPAERSAIVTNELSARTRRPLPSRLHPPKWYDTSEADSNGMMVASARPSSNAERPTKATKRAARRRWPSAAAQYDRSSATRLPPEVGVRGHATDGSANRHISDAGAGRPSWRLTARPDRVPRRSSGPRNANR